MVAVNQALQYPVGSSNEQLRAAVVRLIDVVRQGLGGDVSGDLAVLHAELDALSASFTTLSGDVTTNLGVFEVDLETLESQVTAADIALNEAVTDLLSAVGLVEDDVAALQSGALTPQERFEIALDHAIDTVQGSRREFETWIQDELRRITELVLRMNVNTQNNSASITLEQISRVSETESIASIVSGIEVDLGSANAAILNEQLARADGDNFLAIDVTNVRGELAAATASVTEITSVQSGIQSDVLGLNSDVTGITTDLGQVQAQWGVAINVNGQVVGLVQMDGSASGSQFAIVADKFVVAHPSAPGTTLTPVVVGLVNGVSTIGLNGAVVVDNTILARHLAAGSVVAGTIAAGAVSAVNMNVGALSSITANLGTVTAGLIQSNDGLSYWNLSTGEFVIGAPA